jgi:RNA polymerase sigma factor (sigma-70 family)
MTDMQDAILSELQEGRQRFLALVDEVRPELHRYCARMTGSIADGEDVVQDTLARAYYELSELKELPALRPWLFRIAHNRALDYLRRYERRMSEPLDEALEFTADAAVEPDHALGLEDAMRTAVCRFLALPAAQRSCVILKDVLDHSLEEIAAMLELSVLAVKAALHRGRVRLRELSAAPEQKTSIRTTSPALARYAALFNARDWDGVRAMLVDDVKLDLVTRWKASGRRQVGTTYLTNYGGTSDWYLVPGWLDGREVLAVFRDPRDARAGYFIELAIADGRIAAIHDFRYVPYIGREAAIELSHSSPMG